MAYDDVPTKYIPNYSSDGTDMTLPIASFTELTSAEAHTTTGDIRKIIYAYCVQLYTLVQSLPAADRPTKWLLTKQSSTNDSTGVVTVTYTHQFLTTVGTQEVDDEPS